MSGEAILRTVGIVKKFGGIIALNNVSVDVEKSKVSMLIGPNGSGKSTLINVIGGVIKPDSGKVLLGDRDITKLPPHKRFKLGIVRTFQIPQPFKSLSVLENMLLADPTGYDLNIPDILFRQTWITKERKLIDKAFNILKLLSLDHLWDTRADQLSGGQMKLLEIGRALMSDPKILLLDEPVAGVNPALAHNIMKHIVMLRNKLDLTFLIVEHRLDITLEYVDKVFAMHQGKIISHGPPDIVLKDPQVIEAYLG